MGAETGSAGIAALWVGLAVMMLSTAYFTRASYHSESKHVLYHFVTALVTLIAGLAYLLMACMASGWMEGMTDLTWVHYADWVITTPMLLIDLGMLANMRVAEVAFLAITDALMVGAGFAGITAADGRAAWPFFAFGVIMFMIIVLRLVQRLRKLTDEEPGSAESKSFKFLSIMTVALWFFYPLLFILTKTNSLSGNAETIIYTVLDILAKCLFGAILVGSREVLEGEHTPLALFAMAIIGINPSMRRASSSGVELQRAIQEAMRQTNGGNPIYGKAAGSRRASLEGGPISPASAAVMRGGALGSDSSQEAAVDVERGMHAQGRVAGAARELVASPAGFASPAASAAATNASLVSVLQGLLAQQAATGGRDATVNAQVQAVLQAMAATTPAPAVPVTGAAVPAFMAPGGGPQLVTPAGAAGSASGPGSRRQSMNGPTLLQTLMTNASAGAPSAVAVGTA